MNQAAPTSSRPAKSRGRIMDFAPRKPITTPDPRYAQKPVIRMPAPNPHEGYEYNNVQNTIHHQVPASKPQPRPQPEPKPPVHYVMTPAQPVHKRPLSQPAPTPVRHSAPEPEKQQSPEPTQKPVSSPAPLGARSPFFKKSVSVEKRPLSGGASSVTRSHTTHRQSIQDLPHPQITRSNAVKLSNRKSKLPLVLLIIGTILVGAAVGACAYFLVFQGE